MSDDERTVKADPETADREIAERERPQSDSQAATGSLALDLATPGVFGSGWRRVEATTTELQFSGAGDERTVRYADVERVETFPVGGEDLGTIFLVLALLGLVAGAVARGLSAVSTRLLGTDLGASRLCRYVDEFLAMRDLIRVRLVTADGSVYCYLPEEQAAEQLIEWIETHAQLN